MTLSQSRRETILWLSALGVSPIAFAQPAKEPFRMAVSDRYPPFYIVDDGKVGGIAVDILREVIGKQMGISITFEPLPWARAQKMVENGNLDALCTSPTPKRLEYTVASDAPVLIQNFRLFVRKDNRLLPELKKVRSISDLRKLKPTAISYLGADWMKDNLTGIELLQSPNLETTIRMLLGRRGDIVIENEFTVQSWLSAHKEDWGNLNSNDIVMLPLAYESTNFEVLVSKTSAYLDMLPEFNIRMKAFRKTSGYRKIFQNYGVNLGSQ